MATYTPNIVTITRAKTGNVETYKDGKLVSEETPSGEAIIRVNYSGKSGGTGGTGGLSVLTTPEEVFIGAKAQEYESEVRAYNKEVDIVNQEIVNTGSQRNLIPKITPYTNEPIQQYRNQYIPYSSVTPITTVYGVEDSLLKQSRIATSSDLKTRKLTEFETLLYSEKQYKPTRKEMFFKAVSPLGSEIYTRVKGYSKEEKELLARETFTASINIIPSTIKTIGYATQGKEYRNYVDTFGKDTASFINQRSQFYIDRYNKNTPFKWDYTEYAGLKNFAFGDLASSDYKQEIVADVYARFKAKGLSDELAYKYTGYAITEQQYRGYGEFSNLVAINTVSNKLAGSIKYGLTSRGKVAKTFQYMIPAGFVEGFAGTVNYKASRKGEVNYAEATFYGGLGGLSATGVQYAIEKPAQIIINKAYVTKTSSGLINDKSFRLQTAQLRPYGKLIKASGEGVEIGSGFSAYALDPIGEGLGDFADVLTSGARTPKVRTGVFVNVDTKTKTKTKTTTPTFTNDLTITNNYLPSAKEVSINNNAISFTTNKPRIPEFNIFSQSKNIPKPLTNNLPQTKPITKDTPLPIVFDKTLPVFNIPKNYPVTKSQVYTNPFTNTKPLPQTKPFVFTQVITDIPFLPSPKGGFGGGFSGFGKKSKQQKMYIPSLAALGFNIKGKASKTATLTGLGLRPILR